MLRRDCEDKIVPISDLFRNGEIRQVRIVEVANQRGYRCIFLDIHKRGAVVEFAPYAQALDAVSILFPEVLFLAVDSLLFQPLSR